MTSRYLLSLMTVLVCTQAHATYVASDLVMSSSAFGPGPVTGPPVNITGTVAAGTYQSSASATYGSGGLKAKITANTFDFSGGGSCSTNPFPFGSGSADASMEITVADPTTLHVHVGGIPGPIYINFVLTQGASTLANITYQAGTFGFILSPGGDQDVPLPPGTYKASVHLSCNPFVGTLGSGSGSVTATVPEPASWGLLAVASGLALCRRRRAG